MIRGQVFVNVARCKGCGLCVAACPQGILKLDDTYNAQGYRAVVFHDPHHLCTGCALCAVTCPDVVFTVYRQRLAPTAHDARPESTRPPVALADGR